MHSQLRDKNDIKIFILYLLRHIGYPLDFVSINDIVVQDGYVGYFDFAECFAEMLDDGLIGMTVERVESTEVFCRVENDGVIKSKKSVNVPGAHLSMPYMSQKDREDILFGIRMGFDLISASFTRTAEDILEIRSLLDDQIKRLS